MSLTMNEILEFKSFLASAPRSSCKKLTGQEMTNLKKSHFNEYIKKIKYYARKDLEKITAKNTQLFYKTDSLKDYQNKQKPSNIIKKSRPLQLSQKKHPSYYYLGQADISQLKKYIFLAEQCHMIESRYKRAEEKSKIKDFVNNVERNVQHSAKTEFSNIQSLNLHLTIKSARKIEEMARQRRRTDYLEKLGRRSYDSLPRSFGSAQSNTRKSITLSSTFRTNI